MPPLTSASTEEDLASLEEFPLQGDRQLSTALTMISPSTDELGLKPAASAPRPKRLSLQALKRPLLRATRASSSIAMKKSESKDKNEVKENIGNAVQRSTMTTIDTSHPKDQPNKREVRRVSFSPSTENTSSEMEAALMAREKNKDDKDTSSFGLFKKLRSVTATSKPKIRRSSSFDESIGRKRGAAITDQRHQMRRSLSISSKGIHLGFETSSNQSTTHKSAKDKGKLSKPKVARQQAIAARHARVLERIINSGSSIELEEIKAKRIKKLGEHKVNSRSQAQQYPVVAPRKIKALKQALLNYDLANGIIGELKAMEIDYPDLEELANTAIIDHDKQSEAQEALVDVIEHDDEHAKEPRRKKMLPKPIRAVCLNYTEEEAARLRTSPPTQNPDEENNDPSAVKEGAIALAEASMIAIAVNKIGNWFRAGGSPGQVNAVNVESKTAIGETIQYAYELHHDIKQGDLNEALADTARLGAAGLSVAQPTAGAVAEVIEDKVLPENKMPDADTEQQQNEITMNVKEVDKPSAKISNAFSGVSPISLITQPATTLAGIGARKGGAFDALADVSALAIQHSHGGIEAMQEIKPPTDRMAVFVYWWGFELTIPEPSMKYLGTAHSVSGAFLGFLQTMVTTGGVPELLPFVRYISSFVDMEFNAIRSQDRNAKGVIIAATWLMPLALVPRPWDYGFADAPSAPSPPPRKGKSQPEAIRWPSKPDSPSSPFSNEPRSTQNPPPPLPPGGLPILPVRLSSNSTNKATSNGKGKQRSSSVSSRKSSQEKHFANGQSIAISSANSESPIVRSKVIESTASTSNGMINVLDSLQELPEGSVRVK